MSCRHTWFTERIDTTFSRWSLSKILFKLRVTLVDFQTLYLLELLISKRIHKSLFCFWLALILQSERCIEFLSFFFLCYCSCLPNILYLDPCWPTEFILGFFLFRKFSNPPPPLTNQALDREDSSYLSSGTIEVRKLRNWTSWLIKLVIVYPPPRLRSA